jgi:hypothetical protein
MLLSCMGCSSKYFHPVYRNDKLFNNKYLYCALLYKYWSSTSTFGLRSRRQNGSNLGTWLLNGPSFHTSKQIASEAEEMCTYDVTYDEKKWWKGKIESPIRIPCQDEDRPSSTGKFRKLVVYTHATGCDCNGTSFVLNSSSSCD